MNIIKAPYRPQKTELQEEEDEILAKYIPEEGRWWKVLKCYFREKANFFQHGSEVLIAGEQC
jgi:hypothetical protein